MAGLALVAVIVTAFFQYKTNSLLGNHIMHALWKQSDLLRDISNKLPATPPTITAVMQSDKNNAPKN